MSERPRIGVTGPDEGGRVAFLLAAAAIRRAGGRARRVSPISPCSVEALDGLVLGGGADIDPALYGRPSIPVRAVYEATKRSVGRLQTPLASIVLAPAIFFARKVFEAHVGGADAARDALETKLLEGALRRGIPVLGICRGAQLMNVVAGGTLHSDVGEFYVETPQIRTVLPRKRVRVATGSLLARILGEECLVNALHHQAIDDLAPDYAVVARETNGIVQAIEDRVHRFRIGVQWHPEYMPQDPRQRSLFRAFVDAARAS
jgi:putative glutamine amidotransferase